MDGLMFDTERLGDEVWRAVAGKYGVTMTPEDVSLLRGRNYESGRRAFLERFGAGFPYDDMSAEVWREVEARLEPVSYTHLQRAAMCIPSHRAEPASL